MMDWKYSSEITVAECRQKGWRLRFSYLVKCANQVTRCEEPDWGFHSPSLLLNCTEAYSRLRVKSV